MPKLEIPGGTSVESLDGARTQTLLKTDGLVVARRACVELSTSRSAVTGAIPVQVDAADDSILVLHLDGGFKLFTRHDQFRLDFPGASRSLTPDTFSIDPNLGLTSQDRGIAGSLILKGLEVFDIKPQQSVALAFAAKVERQLDRPPGLYRLTLAPEFGLSAEPAAPPAGGGPALVFIHGTASSSRGSYQAISLATANSTLDFVSELRKLYGDRVFAFEHRTLTESPVQNALQLLQALPPNAELHLVSHSRGGLVGDLLTLGQLAQDPDPALISKLFEAHPDAEALGTLLQLLKDRQLRITRYVRVASPARGTSLASERADRWFSMLLSLFGKLLDHFTNPILAGLYDALQDFLMALAHERLDPHALPGIEAMMPTSPVVRLLNLPTLESASELSVIAGSTQGKDFLGKLKFYLPDLFYGGQHDLVVNFASMDGGVPRRAQRLFPDQGPNVNHLSYFFNPATRQALLGALQGSAEGFQPFDSKPASIPSRELRASASGSRPIVYLLPGLLGSKLAVEGEEVWLNYLKLSFSGLSRLEITASGVKPVSLLSQYYGKLSTTLLGTHDVVEFPFDWRVSLQVEAERLAIEVDKSLDAAERQGQPVRIVAHSMGGVLARVMIAKHPEIWARIKAHPGGRLLMLGTPNGGSYEILRVVTGQSRTIRQLALLDLRESINGIADIVGRYTGLLELLPREFMTPDSWKDLSTVDARYFERVNASLERATETRKLLDSPCDDRMLYVAGTGPDTPVAMNVAGKKVTFMATSEGDSRVPWATGIPANISPYYSTAQHGDLANHDPDFPALLELLSTGSTARLPRRPPAVARDFATPYEMPVEVDEMLPSERDLAAAAMGASAKSFFVSPPTSQEQRIRVEVVHGNLAFARHTVAVGHYAGDSIVGAEGALDTHLDGRLSLHNQLGTYPDRIGSSEVYLCADNTSRPSGAIVMGLGKVGGLNPQNLQETYFRAMLRYALAAKECQDDRFRHPDTDGVTTLLVGTMANVLTVEESLTAMLRAVRAANLALDNAGSSSAAGPAAPFRIRAVEVMEMWEDRVIQTCDALTRIAATPEFKNVLDPVAKVDLRDGGLRRYASGDEEAWWSRLRVTQTDARSPLKFTLFTNRARNETEEVKEPRRAAALIDSAIGSAAADPLVSQALFEMLVPNRLKEFAPEMSRLVLMVDENSAQFPWELFHDRMGRHNRPLAVEAAMVRQLELQDYPPVVVQSDQQTALVIGNPATTKYRSLPAAEAEGRSVSVALEGFGLDVTSHIHSTSAAIRLDLYTGSFRILHLAGHGVHQYQTPEMPAPVSGMVIGDDDFLTPAEIGQMRPVPELVFINCCYLGRIDPATRDSNGCVMAASLAVEFIRMGARAVIAAGWAVDDEAAALFASQFYQSLLQGVAFGEAVRVAREAAYSKFKDRANTWGAYQCYGDPGYCFKKSANGANDGGSSSRMVLPSQLALELDNLARQARAARLHDRERIEGGWKWLRGRAGIDASWWNLPVVQAEEANLLGELGKYPEAIDLYGKAAASGSADVPIRAIEQQANLRARQAARDYAAKAIDLGQFLNEIKNAIERIDVTLSFGETAERLRIKASAFKRKATFVEDDAERIGSLKAMTAAYQRADDLSGVPGDYSDPKMNWLAGGIIIRWFDASSAEVFDAIQQQALSLAIENGRKRAAADPSFWNAVIEPDARLVQFLAAADQPTEQMAVGIVQLYRKAKSQGGSPREAATILEHLDFLARMAERAGKTPFVEVVRRMIAMLKSDSGLW